MKGMGPQVVEEAWNAMLKAVSDPLFWAERLLPALFFLLLGGLFGSFLNVVAYRVPRGSSVMGRRSHCPRCGAMIRSRDNVPVLGWLLLRGRCYACRGWISARYPVVEAIMAAGVMILATRELATNGANLPGGVPGYPDGPDLVFVHASWRVMAMFAWHVALLATLVVWGLFAIDGYQPRLRGRLAVVGLLAGVGIVMPGLIPLDATGAGGWTAGLSWVETVVRAAGVAGAGGLLGWLSGAIPAFLVAPRDAAWMWRAGGGLVGGVLGWQAAVGAMVIASGLAAAWCGVWLAAGGWRPGRSGGLRAASLAVPVAAVIVIGWWQPLLAAVSSSVAHSIFAITAGIL